MFVNFWKGFAQKSDPLCNALFRLLIMFHSSSLVERPETDLRVNLERPVLTLWCDCIVHPSAITQKRPLIIT